MDINNILHKFDEMLAQGQMQAAVDYLESKAAECGEEGHTDEYFKALGLYEGDGINGHREYTS